MADRHLAVAGLMIGALVGCLAAGATDVVVGSRAPVSVLGTSVSRSDLRDLVADTTVSVASQGCGGALEGSGVVTNGGLVVTAGHVTGGARRVRISTADATTVASPVLDAASLDVASVDVPESWRRIPEADADPRPGTAVVVGTRPGGDLRVREARVIGYVEGVESTDPPLVMRLDVGAEPGDSGGPVVDGSGRLVGIVYLRERITGRALVIPVSGVRAALGGAITAGRC
jgi:S1-C subfamily serine protease